MGDGGGSARSLGTFAAIDNYDEFVAALDREGTSSSSDVPVDLTWRLHRRFCDFQSQAVTAHERVEATQMPLDTAAAEGMLEGYSRRVAAEMQHKRDELRKGRWQTDPTVHAEHDALCFCMAVWELAHEVLVCHSIPTAPCVLHWYTRHYLEEELAEWWEKARLLAEQGSSALAPDSFLWELLCRLALSDGRQEVLRLLQRASSTAGAADEQVTRVCDFLSRVPSLRDMHGAKAREGELRQAVTEIQQAARQLLEGRDAVPLEHPVRRILEVYAGCQQDTFEAGKDVAFTYGRTWIEDLAYSHAWICPDIRRPDLGDLLRAVGRRRSAEEIDDTDRVLFAIFTMDIPGLIDLLLSQPDRFPAFFVTHLVDILYFAGRVPAMLDLEGRDVVPPRDWHLMTYARELMRGPRSIHRFALDYLRAGGSAAPARFLRLAAAEHCERVDSEEAVEECMALLVDLELASELGVQLCRRWARHLSTGGDVPGCIRWACRAEHLLQEPRGYFVSELLDELATHNNHAHLPALLAALAPADSCEPLDRYPPTSLSTLLQGPRAPSEISEGSQAAAPSGRLFFFTQYARCRALKDKGEPPSAYMSELVRLLAYGVAPPRLARMIIEDELLPLLMAGMALEADEVMQLMQFVQHAGSDPLQRVRLSPTVLPDLHLAMGTCLSSAILRGSGNVAGPMLERLVA